MDSLSRHVLGTVAVRLAKGKPPAITDIPNVPEREIVFDGQRYEDSGLGDWLGFYDWHRSSDGEVVGIGLWMDDELTNQKPLVAGLMACMNVSSSFLGSLLVVKFDSARTVAPELSGDQDFGDNRLFIGSSGYVLTFNAPTDQRPERPQAAFGR